MLIRNLLLLFPSLLVGAAPASHACGPDLPTNITSLPFCDHTKPIDDRVADLLSRLTLQEKVRLTYTRGDQGDGGVERLGIPSYTWGTEILHGAGIKCVGKHCPTIFPVLANAASSFNRSAWQAMGSAISTEMRAGNNARANCQKSDYVGLNGWGKRAVIDGTPCIVPTHVAARA